MYKFYLLLWLKWAARVTLCSLFFASLFSGFITFFIYAYQGLPTLSQEVTNALFEIAKFWFPIVFSKNENIFEWFNIAWLFGFILLSGYFSFGILAKRCSRVKIQKC